VLVCVLVKLSYKYKIIYCDMKSIKYSLNLNLNIKFMKIIQVIIIIINIIIHVYEFKNEKNYTMIGKKEEMLLCSIYMG